MDFLIAVAGLAVLLASGDALVRGAVALSLRLGVPALIISLTIIAFGTSAPELLIGIEAALSDLPGIVFGNVVGSNIANVLLVLGVPAVISTIDTRDCDSARNFWMMIAVTAIFIALCFLGPLYVWHGVVLLALLGMMLLDAYREARRARRRNNTELLEEIEELEDVDPDMAVWKIAVFILVGVVGLPAGAHLLIEGATGVARAAGVSEAAIGLTLVAVGTSLPELATTVVAALRGRADVAVGNVIGSNLFNLAAILGLTSFFGPLAVPPDFLTFDLWIMAASSLILFPFVCKIARMTRPVGVVFLLAYGAYAWAVLADNL